LVCSAVVCTSYRKMFSQIAELNDPALFHCTAGKDRTGWAAAALLSLLGVPQEIVLEDYLLSTGPVLAWSQPYMDRFAAGGGNQELLKPVFSVEPEYLAAAMRQAELNFGSIHGYFHVGLGLSETVIQRLRMRLLG
jgi:protein-tyrosine phosphatase